jgi:hypothetical protein
MRWVRRLVLYEFHSKSLEMIGSQRANSEILSSRIANISG